MNQVQVPLAMDELEDVEKLEGLIAAAMSARLPQLASVFVCPFSVELPPSEVWIVAQKNEAVLFISLETERFGVGFLADGFDLHNTQQYPTAELAAQAFEAAMTNGAC